MYKHDIDLRIVAHCDVDWVVCSIMRPLVTRFFISLDSSLIS